MLDAVGFGAGLAEGATNGATGSPGKPAVGASGLSAGRDEGLPDGVPEGVPDGCRILYFSKTAKPSAPFRHKPKGFLGWTISTVP